MTDPVEATDAGGRMTDEQRPWQDTDEYRDFLYAAGDPSPLTFWTEERDAALTKLLARVWREAQQSYKSAHVCAACGCDPEDKSRADRAEAQRDRLAAALNAVDGWAFTELCQTDANTPEVRAALKVRSLIDPARAALADVPDVVREVLDDPEAMAAIQRGAAEVARGEPGTLVSALRRKADVPDAGRVQAFRAYVEREAQAIAADPEIDRAARRARLWGEAYRAMRDALKHPSGITAVAACSRDARCGHPTCAAYHAALDALALAQEAEEA